MAKRILPSQAYLRECLDYDPNSGVLRWRIRPKEHFVEHGAIPPHKAWNGRFAGKPAGHFSSDGRMYIGLDYTPYFAHRIIWKWMTDDNPPHEVDHINGNKSDNRWSNLRLATHTENACNRPMQRNNKVGLKGVTWHKATRKYRAVIGQIHLGYFDTPEEAHEAYRRETKRLHGAFWNPRKAW